jgi:hypothetical protein
MPTTSHARAAETDALTGCTHAGVAYLSSLCVQLSLPGAPSLLAAACIATTMLLGSVLHAGVVCGAAASGNYVWNDPTVSAASLHSTMQHQLRHQQANRSAVGALRVPRRLYRLHMYSSRSLGRACLPAALHRQARGFMQVH